MSPRDGARSYVERGVAEPGGGAAVGRRASHKQVLNMSRVMWSST